MKKLDPIPPGEILAEEFLKPLGISQNQLARDIGVPPPRINAIVQGKRAITADTALRLGRYFGVEPEFWMHLQDRYELDIEADALGGRLDVEVRRRLGA
ncbi:MAG: HigA family addiction module antidote protein [Candidatus Sericytochromatia bacterium]|nr:HigA family addiction module antidote protein [Candidatus Tanganyikabacteria bacterium]